MKVLIYRYLNNELVLFKSLDLECIPRKGEKVNFIDGQYLKCFTVTEVFIMLTEDVPYYRVIIEYKN